MIREQEFEWDVLLDSIEEQRVIPVIGSGLFTLAVDGGTQTLDQWLAAGLAEQLDIPLQGVASPPSLNDVTLAYFDRVGDRQPRNKVYRKLTSLLKEPELPLPPAIEQIASIRHFNLFLSFGFDTLLEKAIDLTRFNGQSTAKSLAFAPRARVEDIPCEPEELPVPHVFHLFGLAGTGNEFAVTEEDYLEQVHALHDQERQPKLLFDALRDNSLLFIGCGFPDWLQRFLVRVIANGRPEDRGTLEIFIADQLEHDVELARFLERYCGDTFLSTKPTAFVAELHQRWQQRNPPGGASETPPPTPAKIEAGAVFLSFSRIDKEVVRGLKERLDRAGLDVWFDERDLEQGVAWDKEIQRNINRCAFFLPCISQAAAGITESYFRSEWRLAIERDRKMAPSRRFIQPLILDESDENLADIPSEFWEKQCTRLRDQHLPDPFVDNLVALVKALQLKQAGR